MNILDWLGQVFGYKENEPDPLLERQKYNKRVQDFTKYVFAKYIYFYLGQHALQSEVVISLHDLGEALRRMDQEGVSFQDVLHVLPQHFTKWTMHYDSSESKFIFRPILDK